MRQKVHFIEETVSSDTLLGLMDSLPNLIPEIAFTWILGAGLLAYHPRLSSLIHLPRTAVPVVELRWLWLDEEPIL